MCPCRYIPGGMRFVGTAPPPGRPSFIARVLEFDSRQFRVWQARRADFQCHLMVGTKVDGLYAFARARVPEVYGVAKFGGQQVFGNDAILKLRRQPPFGTDHIVTRQVPPEIKVFLLKPAIHFPAATNLKRRAIHDEHTARVIGAILAITARPSG